MEDISRCILCDEILLNEYNHGGYLKKSCAKKVDHIFSIEGRPFEKLKIKYITICTGRYRELMLRWNLEEQRLVVARISANPGDSVVLPFIELDFKNPIKTINKIKKLLPFI